MKKIVALAAVLLCVFTYITLNAFSMYIEMPQDGYVVTTENALEELRARNGVEVTSVSESDQIFERNSRLYLNRTSIKFNESYPLVLNNTEVCYFFDNSTILLARDFYQQQAYEGMYLSNGISFNYDYSQAYEDEFILARLFDLTYMNAQLIKVKTDLETVYIPNNSFISFEENEINYTKILENGETETGRIVSLLQATISLGHNEFNYTEFYKYLKQSEADSSFSIREEDIKEDEKMPRTTPIVDGGAELTETDDSKSLEIDEDTVNIKELEPEDDTGKPDEEDKGSTEVEGENESARDDASNDDSERKEDEGGVQEESKGGVPKPYYEPVVSSTVEFEPWTYTTVGSFKIEDKGGKIVGGLKVNAVPVDNNDGIETVTEVVEKEGSFDVVVKDLKPDTDYNIVAYYIYENKDQIEETKQVLEQRIHTLSMDEVKTINFEVENDDEAETSNAISLTSTVFANTEKISSSLSEFDRSKLNSIDYVDKIKLNVVNTDSLEESTLEIPITEEDVINASIGKPVSLKSADVLQANSNYSYTISLLDKWDNELPVNSESLSGTFSTTSVKTEVNEVRPFEAWVYTAYGEYDIQDSGSRIIDGITFTATPSMIDAANGLVAVSKTVQASEDDKPTGVLFDDLKPDTEYTIKASYSYYDNDENVVKRSNLFVQDIKTLPIDGNVNKIDFSASETFYTNGVSLKKVKAKDVVSVDTDNEFEKSKVNTISRIDSIGIEAFVDDYPVESIIIDKDNSLYTRLIEKINEGNEEELFYNDDSLVFDPETKYTGKITLYDKWGNVLPTSTSVSSNPNVDFELADYFDAWVYEGLLRVSSYDSEKAYEGVTFLATPTDSSNKFDERQFIATEAGDFIMPNLKPNTEYRVRGYFTYLDEDEYEQTEEIYSQIIKTRPTSDLEPINLTYELDDALNVLNINKFKLENSNVIDEKLSEFEQDKLNTVKFVKELRVNLINNTDGSTDTYSVVYDEENEESVAFFEKLKSGEEFDINTGVELNPSSEYSYEIILLDEYENYLPLTEETISRGDFETSEAVLLVEEKEAFITSIYNARGVYDVIDSGHKAIGGIRFVATPTNNLTKANPVEVIANSTTDTDILFENLVPGTNYDITYKYDYLDGSNTKTFVSETLNTIQTLDVSKANPIVVKYEVESGVYSYAFNAKDFSITNTEVTKKEDEEITAFEALNLDTISHLDHIVIDLSGNTITLSEDENGVLFNAIKNGETKTINFNNLLKQDTNYNYTIKLYDAYDNVLPTTGSVSGTYSTCKYSAPTYKIITALDSGTNTIGCVFELNDPGQNIIDGLTFQATRVVPVPSPRNQTRKIYETGKIDALIDQLEPNTKYNVDLYYSYIDSNNTTKVEHIYNKDITTKPTSDFKTVEISYSIGNNINAYSINFVGLDFNNKSTISDDLSKIERSKLDTVSVVDSFDIVLTDKKTNEQIIQHVSYADEDDIEAMDALTSSTAYDFVTEDVLMPNTEYDVEFVLYDAYENIIPSTNISSSTVKTNNIIKPTVTVKGVRTSSSLIEINANISDPENRLYKNTVSFLFTPTSDTTRSKVITQKITETGDITFIVPEVKPGTEYQLSIEVPYYIDIANTLHTDVIDERIVTTQAVEDLNDVKVEYNVISNEYSKTFALTGFKLSNTRTLIDYLTGFDSKRLDTISNISHIDFVLTKGKTQTTIQTNSDVTCPYRDFYIKAIAGETVDFTSLAILDANSNYTYEIRLYDKWGNVLPTKPSNLSGEYKTISKQPVITQLSDFEPWVYMADAEFDIVDKENKLNIATDSKTGKPLGTLTFVATPKEVSEDNPVITNTITATGKTHITLMGLKPETEYTVQLHYTYTDDYSQIIDVDPIDCGSFKTLSLSKVEPVYVTYTIEDACHSRTFNVNEMVFKNSKVSNTESSDYTDLQLNTLAFVEKIEMRLVDSKDSTITKTFTIVDDAKDDTFQRAVNGKKVNYVSNGTLSPDTTYNYEIVLLDKWGNKIPTIPQQVKGKYSTKEVEVVKNAIYPYIYSVRAYMKVTDDGDRITDEGISFSFSPLDESLSEYSVTKKFPVIKGNGSYLITGLMPNTKYNVSAHYKYYNDLGTIDTAIVINNETVQTYGIGSMPRIYIDYSLDNLAHSNSMELKNFKLHIDDTYENYLTNNNYDYNIARYDSIANVDKVAINITKEGTEKVSYQYSIVYDASDLSIEKMFENFQEEIPQDISFGNGALKENTVYTYNVALYDKFGNKMATTDNTGLTTYTTSGKDISVTKLSDFETSAYSAVAKFNIDGIDDMVNGLFFKFKPTSAELSDPKYEVIENVTSGGINTEVLVDFLRPDTEYQVTGYYYDNTGAIFNVYNSKVKTLSLSTIPPINVNYTIPDAAYVDTFVLEDMTINNSKVISDALSNFEKAKLNTVNYIDDIQIEIVNKNTGERSITHLNDENQKLIYDNFKKGITGDLTVENVVAQDGTYDFTVSLFDKWGDKIPTNPTDLSGIYQTNFINPNIVKIKSFVPGVYTSAGRFLVNIPENIANINANFEFVPIDDDSTIPSVVKTVKQRGDVEVQVRGLKPDTDYEIKGYITYSNDRDEEEKVQIYSQFIHTLGTENCNPIKVEWHTIDNSDPTNETVYSNSLYFDKLLITNNQSIDSRLSLFERGELNVVANIGKVVIDVVNENDSTDKASFLINSYVENDRESYKRIIKGVETIYNSPTKLKANSTYNYEISIYDAYGNKLVTEPSTVKGTYSTGNIGVSVTLNDNNFEPWVYSMFGSINVNDPGNRIVGGIKVYATPRTGDASFIVINEKGENVDASIHDLKPNTTYTMSVQYSYLNANDKQVDVEIYNKDLKTLPVSSLQPLVVKADLDSREFSNKISLKNFSIVNSKIIDKNVDDNSLRKLDTLQYLTTLKVITTSPNSTKEITNVVDRIKAGEIVDAAVTGYTANTSYSYRVAAYDKWNNEIPTNNLSGRFMTCGYQDPVVNKLGDYKVGVYTVGAKVHIEDAASRINTDGVVFVAKPVGVNTGLDTIRTYVKETGDVEVVIRDLKPETKYELSAYYVYRNEAGSNVTKNELFKETIITQSVDQIPAASVSFLIDEREYPNSASFKNITIKNTVDTTGMSEFDISKYDTMSYVETVDIVLTSPDGSTSVDAVIDKGNKKVFDSLMEGKPTDYKTNDILITDAEYAFVFELHDKWGNKLATSPSYPKGFVKTSKVVASSTTGEGSDSDEVSENNSSTSILIVQNASDFEAWTYTAASNFIIYDTANRIQGSVTFKAIPTEEGTDAKTVTKYMKRSGEIVLSGLKPDTEYRIEVSYKYKDDENNKKTAYAFEQVIRTLDIDQVKPVNVSYSLDTDLYAKSISLKEFQISNSDVIYDSLSDFEKSKLDTISYVDVVRINLTNKDGSGTTTIDINNKDYKTVIKEIVAGNVVNILSKEDLKSNSEYDYTIELYDKWGNKLVSNPEDIIGSCRTKKVDPSIIFNNNLIMPEINEPGNIVVPHIISDEDSAIVPQTDGSLYRYHIYNEAGNSVNARSIITPKGKSAFTLTDKEYRLTDFDVSMTMTNMPFNQKVTLEVVADIDLNDGLGVKKDVVVGTYRFQTSSPGAGSLTYNVQPSNVKGTSATVTFEIITGSSMNLANQMTNFHIIIEPEKNEDENLRKEFMLYKYDYNDKHVGDKGYEYDNRGVIIQKMIEEEGQPQIRLVGDAQAFEENIWQAFINGADVEKQNAAIEISFPAQSLEPSTSYTVYVESLIDEGESYYGISTRITRSQFTTLRREPVVVWDSFDIINNSVSFTVHISDTDSSIRKWPTTIELISGGIVYDSVTIEEPTDVLTHKFKDLMDNESYTLSFKAKEYNNSDTTSNKVNYEFYFKDFKANSNINGSITIGNLQRKQEQICDLEIDGYFGKNLISDEFNIMKRPEVQADIVKGYRNDSTTQVANEYCFATGYIPFDENLPKTLLIRNFADTVYYGNYPDGTYYGSWLSYYVYLYQYQPATDTYKYLGHAGGRYCSGDYVDIETDYASLAANATHFRYSGVNGYEDVAELYQGIKVQEILDTSVYVDTEYWEEKTILNGYGEMTVDNSFITINDPIPVTPGDLYFYPSTNLRRMAFYDEDDNGIVTFEYYQSTGYKGFNITEGRLFVVPNNAVSMRLSFANNTADKPANYLRRLTSSNDVFESGLDISLEDRAGVFTEPTQYRLKSYIGTDVYYPQNHDALVKFKDDIVNDKFFSEALREDKWDFYHDFTFDLDTYYYFELYLETNGKSILLDTADVYTESDWKYIYSWNDFDQVLVDPYGQYKVMADIVVPHRVAVDSSRITINGTLDFNGHTFTPSNTFRGISVGVTGTVENAIIDYSYPDDEDGHVLIGSPIYVNYGTVRNIICRYDRELYFDLTYGSTGNGLDGTRNFSPTEWYTFCHTNYGTGVIENVAFLINKDIHVGMQDFDPNNMNGGLGLYRNYGLINNCYLAATNNSTVYINNTDDSKKITFGLLLYINECSGRITNCYSAVEVWQRPSSIESIKPIDLSPYSSNFVNYNYYGGVIENCFAVGDRGEYNPSGTVNKLVSYKLDTRLPALAQQSNAYVKNFYYFAQESNEYTTTSYTYGLTRSDYKNLFTTDWYYKNLGFKEYNETDGGYLVRHSVNNGYYPRLHFPTNMAAKQPYIKITGAAQEDAELRVINAVVERQSEDEFGVVSADVKIYIYNPNAKEFTGVNIKSLNTSFEGSEYDSISKVTTVEIHITNPTEYLSSYPIDTLSYVSGKQILNLYTDVEVPCEFYCPISSPADWASKVVKDPTQNYRLVNDIDFASISSEASIYINKNFTGKLDGTNYNPESTTGCYSLKNITLGDSYQSVINNLNGGKITNLIVDNLSIDSKKSLTGYVGFVRYSNNSKSVIDNVHITNSYFAGCSYTGALIADGLMIDIFNSSVTNTKVVDYKPTVAFSGTSYYGGLAGVIERSTIENCFTGNVDIEVRNSVAVNGVGGLTGYIYRTNIASCYTHGTIYNYARNTGGLIGYVHSDPNYVHNCYTYVNIEGADSIGGISGFDNGANATNKTSNTQYRNMFALGNIVVSGNNYEKVHRLFGSNILYGDNVYAFAGQTIKPAIDDQPLDKDDARRLIENAELTIPSLYQYEIALGDQYDYSVVSGLRMPLLKNRNTGVLLPNQPVISFEIEGLSFEVVYAKAFNEFNVPCFTAQVIINHPADPANPEKGLYSVYEDTFAIDGMTPHPYYDDPDLEIGFHTGVDIERTPTQTIITTITEKEKALDQYTCTFKLESVRVAGKPSTYSQAMSVAITYDEPIYWEIANYNQWRNIMKTHGYTNENFKITGDIDFEYDNEYKYTDLIINRLVGQRINIGTGKYRNPVFSHINFVAPDTSAYIALVSKVSSAMENVDFDSITLDMSKAKTGITNYGLISSVPLVNNVGVSNFELRISNKTQSTNVGFIGNVSGNVYDFKADNVTIFQTNTHTSNRNYSIGTIGYISGGLTRCDFSNITIRLPRNLGSERVGLVAGYYYPNYINYDLVDYEDDEYTIHVTGNNTVVGYYMVGGIFGRGDTITVGNVIRRINNADIENVTVDGHYYVGGLLGYYGGLYRNINLRNANVTGDYIVGGLAGRWDSEKAYITADNVNVSGIYRVGGVAGLFYTHTYGMQLTNFTVKGNKEVGGLAGRLDGGYSIYDIMMENFTVTGEAADMAKFEAYQTTELVNAGYTSDGSSVGGYIGYATGGSAYRYYFNNIKVTGTNEVGGYIGRGYYTYFENGGSNIDVVGEDRVGGIVGFQPSATGSTAYRHWPRRIFYQGSITGHDYVGAVAGLVEYVEPTTGVTRTSGFQGAIGDNNKAYSLVMNVSMKATGDNPVVNFYTVSDVTNDTRYCGTIDNLTFLNTSDIWTGSGYRKIKESDLPVMYVENTPDQLYEGNPAQIIDPSGLDSYSVLYSSRKFGGLGFNSDTIFKTDRKISNYAFDVTQTDKNAIEISGLDKNSTYNVKVTLEENQQSDEGLLLYYDSFNHSPSTGNTDETVWENLGSLGSNYDMNVVEKTPGSGHYHWNQTRTDGNSGGFHVDYKTMNKNNQITATYSDVYLETDHELGRITESDDKSYTISVSYRDDMYNAKYNVFLLGTSIDISGYTSYAYRGPSLNNYYSTGSNNRHYFQGFTANSYNNYDDNNNVAYDHVGKFDNVTLTNRFLYTTTSTAYYKMSIYVNGQLFKESVYSEDWSSRHKAAQTTEGWIHMLCTPKKTLNGDGSMTTTYTYSPFTGDFYSARMYDHALTPIEVESLYRDEVNYYVNNNTDTQTTGTLTGAKPNADGVIVIPDLSSLGIPANSEGNIKVTINNTTANLNYFSNRSTLYGVTVRDASTPALNKINSYCIENKPIVLSASDEGAYSVNWYRSSTNGYHGELIASACKELYVDMSGYYYADIDGHFTPIVKLKNDYIYFPQVRSYYITAMTSTTYDTELRYAVPNSEGKDHLGQYNSVEDKLINGGIKVVGFDHDYSNGLMSMPKMLMSFSQRIPELLVYTSDVNAITFELADDATYPIALSVTNDNGVELFSTNMFDRTVSMTYDFETPITIKWSSDKSSSSVRYDASELVNTIATYGNDYYYITANGINTKTTTFDIDGLNIYKDKVLSTDGNIYDLNTGFKVSENLPWEQVESKPLFYFGGSNLETYYSHSVVKGLDGYEDTTVKGQVLMLGDNSYILSPVMTSTALGVSQEPRGVILDKYSGKTYLTVINEGILTDLYDEIAVPEGFCNYNIKEMTNSLDSDSHIVLIRYNNGTLVGFNYLTGEAIDVVSQMNEGFIDFVTEKFATLMAPTRTSPLTGTYKTAMLQSNALGSTNDNDVVLLFSNLMMTSGSGEGQSNGIVVNGKALPKDAIIGQEPIKDEQEEVVDDFTSVLDTSEPSVTVIPGVILKDNRVAVNNIVTSENIHGVDCVVNYDAEQNKYVIETVDKSGILDDSPYVTKLVIDGPSEEIGTSEEKGTSEVIDDGNTGLENTGDNIETGDITDEKDEDKLQDKIDELAEKNTIPGLSSGIVKTNKQKNVTDNYVGVVFAAVICLVFAVLAYFFLSGKNNNSAGKK